ncbi:hypothetical protein OPV22_029318 [Ensete ventricosum]|uniref:DUF834 domain-containing protein n=1 Tax=Ensete ventricosum TaxID=4639 RepID=A0AAV8Q2U5_ENSVE|nr:hypothetical protein OPV22_029318 [Ensete ventricosum]
MWEKMLEQGRGKGRKRVVAISGKRVATLLVQVEKKAAITMTTTTWVIGGDGKSNDGRGDRGNEQRLRTVATAEEGEVATMIEEHGVAMAAVDSGIVVVAMESTIVGKGNDVTRGGGR